MIIKTIKQVITSIEAYFKDYLINAIIMPPFILAQNANKF
jgi:hypothetical protein